jgi:type IV pilus assembly protein PilO
MANFGELSGVKQLGVLIGGAALVTAALYFTVFKSQRDANTVAQQKLEAKLKENAELESYRPRLKEIEQQLVILKQQLDIEKRIVPDEKEVDGFMRMLDAEAGKAGIEIRRYTAKPYGKKEFYTEVPFEMEVDGPYYSMLNFFDRVSKLDRIVNISNLLVASVHKPQDAKAKHSYQYAPNESVVATCTATTFFSHDMEPPATTAKPGQPARPGQAPRPGPVPVKR